MIGETTMKCKYIDQKKILNFKRKCALSFLWLLTTNCPGIIGQAISPKMNSKLNFLYRFYFSAVSYFSSSTLSMHKVVRLPARIYSTVGIMKHKHLLLMSRGAPNQAPVTPHYNPLSRANLYS
jgi:hypothetical protein